MKVFLLIPVYKRAKIFELVYKRLNDIRLKSKLNITIIVAGNLEDECKNVYQKLKQGQDEYIICNNTPVSNKFNALHEYLKGEDFDYSITTGSDDIISDYAWQLLENAIIEQQYHYICFKDLNFYDSVTKKVGYYATKEKSVNKSIGCYRALHKNILETLKYKPYEDGRNNGIDFTMEQKMHYLKGVVSKEITVGNKGHIVDVKSNVNINSYQYLEKIFNLADVNNFPQEIKDLLCQL
jgi:hypothetical protein